MPKVQVECWPANGHNVYRAGGKAFGYGKQVVDVTPEQLEELLKPEHRFRLIIADAPAPAKGDKLEDSQTNATVAPVSGAVAAAGGATAEASSIAAAVVRLPPPMPNLGKDSPGPGLMVLNAGQNPIEIIRIIRDVTGQGLQEIKDQLDAGGLFVKAPYPDWLKASLTDAGAKVEIRT
jgi:ribosomal protein L7/L12